MNVVWPIAVTLLILLGREVWFVHRRSQINQALHEARRPLQAIALSLPSGPGRLSPALPVWQAIRALGEIDRQLNGGAPDRLRPEPIACRLMTEACVRRWQSRSRMAGGSLELRWTGPEALVTGDPVSLSAAIENLILNAIEHGGPRVAVRVLVVGQRLRIEVTDSGAENRGRANENCRPGVSVAKVRGRERHGHGLAVVRAAASAHDGWFRLDVGESATTATLVLPCETAVGVFPGTRGPARVRARA